MVLTFFLIPLNIILVGMMIFLVFAFRRERRDENAIKERLETIKKNYDDMAAASATQAAEAKKAMEDALAKAKSYQEESQKVTADCEIKINKMEEEVKAETDRLHNLEDTIRAKAEENIKEFEKEQKAEVEKNMVSLVMNITKEVLAKTLSYDDHKQLIENSIKELKMTE